MSRQFAHHHNNHQRPTALNGGPSLVNGGGHQNGNSDLYQQLLDSSDLVKELDDIEAISQQISQHAEVLYQNWQQSQQQPKVQPAAYGAGVGYPKRSTTVYENGLKSNGSHLNHAPPTAEKVSPLSSPTATLTSPSFVTKAKAAGPKLDLNLPEVNGNLKDLVNSFVSTDRAKQAARQTISSTITNQMNKNKNGVRSPSPTSSGSSPFSSRGVSPLRSPMLASSLALSPGAGPGPPPLGTERRLMDAFPTNASIMNSVHMKMPPLFSPPSSSPTSPVSTTHHGPELVRIPVQHLPSSNGATTAHANGSSLRSPSMINNSTTSTTSIPSLHAAHVENMKKRFEEAKERINAMHQRATANSFPFLSNLPHADPFDEVDFFSRNRRPQRPLVAPPHPELTPMQKQHISERSIPQTSNLTAANNAIINAAAPPKRFGGSVAERVMIFERCPVFGTNDPAKEVKMTMLNNDHKPQSRPVNPPAASASAVATAGNNASATPWKHLQQEGLGKVQTPRGKVVRDIPISTLTFPSVAPSSPTSTLPSVVATSSTLASAPAKPTAITPTSLQVLTTPSSFLSSPSLNHSTPASAPSAIAAAPVFSSPILTPTSRASSASTSPASTLSRVSRPPSIIVTGKEKVLPRFHFPLGNPATGPSGDLTKFADEFRKHKNSTVSVEELGQVLKACGYPLYWKGILFSAAGGDKTGLLSYVAFSDFWRKLCASHHDEAAQFMHVLTCKSGKNRNVITPEEFVPLVQDVVDTHPGLGFLKEATEFHSRYVHTVIARIFFVVNRSWSGLITLSELRRSNLLATLRLLEEEDDINQITDFFSYEHFYVIYCKFWELDKDHDLFIDREDLARHNDHAISARMIDRIFSGAVTRGAAQQEGKMSYTEFVWFLLAEEDKRAPTSIEYWFRCMDLDGDGILSMYELEYFYEEQLQRMEQLGIETLPFEDCLCQMLDMIMPKKHNVISLQDLKSCRMTPIFFDTFFNLEKYLDHEQRDPFASQRDVDEDGNEMSDWDRFAAEEYELLVAEEGNAEGMDDMCYEDDPDGNAEMQLEQALDENDLIYHDTMISTAS